MIKTFRHKGLKALFENDDRSKVRADQVEKVTYILAALDAARDIDDMNMPAFRLHQLKGKEAGLWSVRVNKNWRIVFEFQDGDASVVDLIDYH